MGHDYPKIITQTCCMGGYGWVCWGMRGLGRVWEDLESLEAVWGGMGHDLPEKWTNFINRPVASTSLFKVQWRFVFAEVG